MSFFFSYRGIDKSFQLLLVVSDFFINSSAICSIKNYTFKLILLEVDVAWKTHS